jgi:hypothetical protein
VGGFPFQVKGEDRERRNRGPAVARSTKKDYLEVATCHVLATCSFIRSSFLYDPFLIPHSFRPSGVKEAKFKGDLKLVIPFGISRNFNISDPNYK